jgi:2-polyprenyl-3-methyl-5-hydroxy-6-metoxy-1,4-benzoquinol methylase
LELETGAKLLDAGCGLGDFTQAFKEVGIDAIGLDREVDFETERFPFKEQFDVVFSKSVIEHLWKPDNFIKEIKRVLKPNGKVVIMTPDWQSQMRIFYNDYTHVHPYDKDSLRDLLEIYNFKEIETEKFYQLPILWKYPLLKIISRILRIFPVKGINNNKFIRWSRELMILAIAKK